MGAALEAIGWVIDNGLNFAVQLGVAGLVAALLAWGLGWQRLALLAGLSSLVLWAWVGYRTLGALPLQPAAQGQVVRVLTFNIKSTTRNHDEKISMIRAVGADIVFLQETNPRWWEKFQVLRDLYPHMHRVGPIGVLVFSRHPLGPIEDVISASWPPQFLPPHYLQAHEGVTRGLRTRVEIDGRPLTLVSFHATKPASTWQHRAKLDEFAALARLSENTAAPLIVAGDFNTTPLAWSMASLERRTGLRGLPWRLFRPRTTWPSGKPHLFGLQIDHILARGPLVLKDYEILSGTGSNHRPIVADFVLLPGTGDQTRSAAERP